MVAIKYKDPTDGLFKTVPVGGVSRSVNVISGATTAGAATKTEYVYVCWGASPFTLTLPTAVGNSNCYTVKRTATANITVATTGGQTIDGISTFVLDVQYMAINLVSDGANWVII